VTAERVYNVSELDVVVTENPENLCEKNLETLNLTSVKAGDVRKDLMKMFLLLPHNAF
jgi:hypothetical protein